MSDIVGIDLGTTNSLIGSIDAGFPVLIANEQGERLTPSVVYFPENGEPIVGHAADRMRVVDPAATVYSIKRFIGRRVGEEVDDVSYHLTGAPGTPVRVNVRGQVYAPEQISALILRQLKNDAQKALQREITRAVITVPAYFNDAQRNMTKRAGEIAGLSVERIVNEPTAAALAYGLDRLQEKSKIAVYDFGGGTFDISILELNKGVFQVVATHGNTRLGGDDIDAKLVEVLRADFEPDSPAALARLREAAIEAKHQLSFGQSTEIELPFLDGSRSVSKRLTRNELESIARPIVERTRGHCFQVMADAKLKPAELNEVILVGGATRMPLVRELVRDIFQRDPNTTQNPDETVAIGATIQAGILSGALQNMVLLDVTPLSLGLETFGGLMNVIIPRNSTIPIKAGEMFTNAVANQRSMLVRVLQGEREMARDNWQLGEFTLDFEPSPKGQARVGVQFEIDADGILHVLARDTQTGREKQVEMSSAVDVSDEAVEKMIAESVEHAFDDMSERVFTEAKLKSEEMIPAVRSALTITGDQLADDEKRRIEQLLEEVKVALAAGEVQRLKKANTALDEATQHLAALLVERAISEHDQRRHDEQTTKELPAAD